VIKKIGRWTNDVKISVAALIVSLIAVALSQFHPLYTYIDKAKLDAEISNIQFYQAWGRVGISAFVQLWNDGRASGQVSRVDIFIERETESARPLHLNVQTYYPVPPSISMGQIATQVPWSHVILIPDGSWSYWVNCFTQPSDQEQSVIDGLTAEMQAQLSSQPAASANPGTLKFVDQELFDRISAFVRNNLGDFADGRYFALVAVWGNRRENPIIVKGYTFSVPTTYVRLFSTGIDQFRSGAGILFPPQVSQGPVISLTPIHDQRLAEKLRKDFALP
jgi:hypothetical protein